MTTFDFSLPPKIECGDDKLILLFDRLLPSFTYHTALLGDVE